MVCKYYICVAIFVQYQFVNKVNVINCSGTASSAAV